MPAGRGRARSDPCQLPLPATDGAPASGSSGRLAPSCELSDHAVSDLFRLCGDSHLGSVDLNFDAGVQVGGSGDRLRGQLVDRVILSQHAHRWDEQAQIDYLEVGRQSTYRLSDR